MYYTRKKPLAQFSLVGVDTRYISQEVVKRYADFQKLLWNWFQEATWSSKGTDVNDTTQYVLLMNNLLQAPR